MAGLCTSDGQGGSIDDITLTALGGPHMSGAPTAFVTIPEPHPQPLTSSGSSFTGFSITYEPQYK
jgi:hypothetical protein